MVISTSNQAITADVGGHLVTSIHAYSLTINTRSLWADLSAISTLNKPWMIIGDFNAVLSIQEKKGGRNPLTSAMLDFNNCIQNCDLIQAPKTGWGYKVGTRGISDHSPLFGASASLPKPLNVPFRALKVWMSHEGFKKIIEEAWKVEVRGNPGFIFLIKLKQLKIILKNWNWNIFGDVRKKIQQADEEVMRLSIISDQSPSDTKLLNDLVTSRGIQELVTQQQQEIDRQKAKVKWMKFGASNSKNFHVNMKIRQMHNVIVELENEDNELIVTQQGIADVLVKHFENKFKHKEVQISEEVFDAVSRLIFGEDNAKLESIPSTEEIKQAVFDLDPDSSPGPDGFGGWFYKFAWDLISEDFIQAIQLRIVVQKIVSPQQATFIKGRNIQDQIVLASEMVNELDTKRRRGNAGLKLDISQAYDSLSWEFLFHALRKFIKWIHILLKSGKISVLVNGGPAGFFNISRGLRQGDPISPLLFVIAEDVLSTKITSMVLTGKLLPMVHRNGVQPTHIMFADDIFLFCNGDRRNLKRLLRTLEEYQKASVQEVNLSKSKCFVGGTSNTRKIQVAADCGMVLSDFPDKYLGVIIIPGLIRTHHCSSGQKKVSKESEKIIRNFLWYGDPSARKTITLKWEKTCSPIEEGGLGIRQLEVINRAMLMKLCWKIQNGKNEWAKFFQGKFQDKNGNWIEYYKKSSIWPGIKWVAADVFDHSRCLVGDGKNISVWNDIWIKERYLKDIFPDNSTMLQNPNMKVAELIRDGEWQIPNNFLDFFEISELPVMDCNDDRRIWSANTSGEFTVASAAEIIRKKFQPVHWEKQCGTRTFILMSLAMYGR
ncbi:uncharacterized protein LOC113331560 [Papaver somniferum]|uniref:uncharacterized protein LOC113331560 n=1 Tax=Papaver somniferum TaxID=3469 RepID=UPI000E6FF0AD|nr:uncharacterized protein LOC113331560 [Papaver somniferum]